MTELYVVTPPSNEVRAAVRKEPTEPEVMFQTWSNLLFLHWEADPLEIQKTLPPGLFVDTHGGKAYIGVIPFFITDLRAANLPPIPGTTNFLELNVRTYVYDLHGRPGVWFYSLDCNQTLAVWAARILYCLPYQHASMHAEELSGSISYTCHRNGTPEHLKSQIHYKAKGERLPAPIGSLPFFLAERYFLFAWAERAKTLYSARVFHSPYELFHVHLGKWDDSMLKVNGFTSRLRAPDHQMIAPSPLRVKIFGLETV